MDTQLLNTRQRLLEAAGEVFAERGFQAATVKEICQRAEANIAAINYHFRDKASLYSEVVKYTQQRAREKYAQALDTANSPEERLRQFILTALQRMLDPGRPAWHGRLMAREMMDPTPALDSIIHEAVVPLMKALYDTIREILGPAANDQRVQFAGRSIIAQCVYYSHSRPVIERLEHGFDYSPEGIKKIAAQVTDFSLAALKQMRSEA
jgi:AcrR family transcriptional regulator